MLLTLLQKLTERALWRSRDPWGHLQAAPRLPETALKTARLYSDRESMLEALPKGGRVAEVGVWKGDFSRVISRTCAPVEFHLIDLDFGALQPLTGPIEKHKGDSSAILNAFEPESLD